MPLTAGIEFGLQYNKRHEQVQRLLAFTDRLER